MHCAGVADKAFTLGALASYVYTYIIGHIIATYSYII